MEDRQGQRTSKASIIKGLNATVPPINIQMDNHLVIGGTEHYHQETNCNSPTMLDRYAEKLDRSTPIVKYFRSQSPVVGKLPSVGDTFSTPVGNVINANYRSAIINHYASSTSGSGSFGSWGGGSSLSPLSSIENLETPSARSPQIYGTPVKVDEEVIVMDGILISSVPAGAKTSRSGSDSGSGGGSSLGKNQHKTDICRSWEDSGSCRYGHKCQFAHGQEELRPTRLAVKTKSKFGESYGPKFRNNHALLGVAVTTSPSNLIDIINKTDQLARKDVPMSSTPHTTTSTSIRHMNSKPTPISTISIVDWSPEDDGIEVVLPNSGIGGTSKREDANRETSKREGVKKKETSKREDVKKKETSKREDVKKKETSKREDVNKHIHGVLYGSTERPTKKRLPVFGELTSEKPQKE